MKPKDNKHSISLRSKSHLRTAPGWSVSARPASKSWRLAGTYFSISNLTSGFITKGQFIPLPLQTARRQNARCLLEFANEQLKLVLDFAFLNESWCQCDAYFTVIAQHPLQIESVVLARIDPAVADRSIDLHAHNKTYRVLINAFDAGEQTGSRPCLRRLFNKNAGDVPADTSSMVTAVWSTESRCTVLFGSLCKSDFPLSFQWARDLPDKPGTFALKRHLELTIEPGRKIPLGTLLCNQSKQLTTALSEYASRYFKPLRTPTEMFTGWSTWDYYLFNPTLKDVKENIKVIRSDAFLCEKIKFISIDCGWFNYPGDWRANIDFQSNRAAIALQITKEGFIPGIWTMPLLVGPNAPIVRTNVGWFIRDDNGDHVNVNAGEWPDVIFSLDFTVPEVRDYIYDLYSRM